MRRRNINRDAIVRRQLTAPANHIHHLAAVLGITHSPEVRRRSRVDPRQSRVDPCQRERPHAQPLCSDEFLNRGGGKSGLVGGVGDRQRLPAVHVHEIAADARPEVGNGPLTAR